MHIYTYICIIQPLASPRWRDWIWEAFWEAEGRFCECFTFAVSRPPQSIVNRGLDWALVNIALACKSYVCSSVRIMIVPGGSNVLFARTTNVPRTVYTIVYTCYYVMYMLALCCICVYIITANINRILLKILAEPENKNGQRCSTCAWIHIVNIT